MMVRQKGKNATELDTQVTKAVLGVRQGLYKSSYATAKALGLNPKTVVKSVNGGLSRSQARQQQQKLSCAQENVFLKWFQQLTISGYSPGHLLVKEMTEEIRKCQTYNLFF